MNKFYKLIILNLVFLCFSIKTNAQDVIATFKNHPNIETVSVNKKMFQMMSNVKMDLNDKENVAYLNLIKKLDDLKLVSTKNNDTAKKLKTFVTSYISTNSMSELMSLTENGLNTIFYVDAKSTKNNIKELLMFVQGNETIILSLKGDFNLNELSIVTSKMKLPVGNSLNNINK